VNTPTRPYSSWITHHWEVTRTGRSGSACRRFASVIGSLGDGRFSLTPPVGMKQSGKFWEYARSECKHNGLYDFVLGLP